MTTALLFDLDGTLVDSEDGIVDSLQHALRAMGRPAMTRDAASVRSTPSR